MTDEFTSIIKKARRKTILRNTVISLIVSILVLGAGFIGNLQLLYKSGDDALRDIWMFKHISGPNLYEGGYQETFGLFSGTLEYETYKIVEGVPIVWERKPVEFNILGNFSPRAGSYSSIQIPTADMKEKGFDYYRHFNPYNGKREMLFYLPSVNYGKYMNDLPQLSQMDKNKLVEMGISFDKNYTVDQIKRMLPHGVHPVWYWVDTYYNKEQYQPQKVVGEQKMPDGSLKQVEQTMPAIPDTASQVYGFGAQPENTNVTEKNFLNSINDGLSVKGRYYNEYKKIFDYLRGSKAKPAVSDVKIIGVVVTGTAESLKALNGQSYLKAAVLGAIVDKY